MNIKNPVKRRGRARRLLVLVILCQKRECIPCLFYFVESRINHGGCFDQLAFYLVDHPEF